MYELSSVNRGFYIDTQLNAAVIKRHIIFQTTTRIISETVWSSNAFSLAGLLQGEYIFISCFFTYILSSTAFALSVSDAC